MTDKPTLSKTERRALQSQAHSLKPELNVGRTGMSDSFLKSLYEAFNTKELLKIKLLDTSDETRASLSEKLGGLTDILLIQNVGKTFILYKKMEEPGADKA